MNVTITSKDVIMDIFLIKFFVTVNNKQKWVPLEIDLAKSRGKRDRSPKHHYREKNGKVD